MTRPFNPTLPERFEIISHGADLVVACFMYFVLSVSVRACAWLTDAM